MTVRILHLSDLHLDRAFAGLGVFGEVARRRRADLRAALRNAGAEALRRGCDLLTIGGDLFEADRAGPDTARFLSQLFASWQPLRVVIAPGNHDPVMPGSLWEQVEWPDNVHVFTEPVLRPLSVAPGVTLWGLGHREPAWMGDPLATGPGRAAGGVHLALFHGAELGSRPDRKSIHGPFHARDIAARGFDLALCGHYHVRRVDTGTGLVYPGSPEPLTFDEEGPRGPVVVTVDERGRPSVEALTINRWHAVRADADLGGAATVTAVADAVRAAAATAVAGLPGDTTMLRLTLRGELGPEVAVDLAAVEQAAADGSGATVVRIRDLTTAGLDIAAAAADRTARGAFTQQLLADIAAAPDGAERALLEDALRYGLQALAGVDVGLREGVA